MNPGNPDSLDIELLRAIGRDDTERVRELIRLGADPTARNREGRTPKECVPTELSELVDFLRKAEDRACERRAKVWDLAVGGNGSEVSLS